MTDIRRRSGQYKLEVYGEKIIIIDDYNSHYTETAFEGLPFLLKYYNYIMNNNVSGEGLHIDIMNYKRVFGELPPYNFSGNYVKKHRVSGLLGFIQSSLNYDKKYTRDELEQLDYEAIKSIYYMRKAVGNIPTECSTI